MTTGNASSAFGHAEQVLVSRPTTQRALCNVHARREDWQHASIYNEETQQAERQALWRNLASGAESGWDFSSRWFAPGGAIDTIRVTDILPSDLNAYLYQVCSSSEAGRV